MIQTQELSVNSLDFDEIKQNFISFLKDQKDNNNIPIYQDFNFESSGISTILNLLSYNTHYIGYYIKMLLNESFIDSSVKRESLLSKAKLMGYTPRGKTASRVSLRLQVDIDINNPNHYEPPGKNILISRGSNFISTNTNFDSRVFYNIDNIFIDKVETISPGKRRYTSDYFNIYEGQIQEWKFKTDTSLLNQRYIIKDKNIDIDTIRVFVGPNQSSSMDAYFLSENVMEVESDSKVFYLITQENGFYEIVFGNNVFGKSPSNNSIIHIFYISTNGESGNGCRSFQFNAISQGIPTETNIGNWEDMNILLDIGTISSGGSEEETIDSLRFTIPHHHRRQNRLVTEHDYKQLLLSEFRNINSISVWGGEKNYIREYGKIFISIKPKYADFLTETAKRDIEQRLITQYSIIGMQPVFVNPEFINVETTIYCKINPNKTTDTFGKIETDIITTINSYNKKELNIFDNFYSDVLLLEQIKKTNKSIVSCFSKNKINKDQEIIYASQIENTLYIGNALQPGIISSLFSYGTDVCYFKDDLDGFLYIYKTIDNSKLLINSFGRVDYNEGIIYYFFPTFAQLLEKNFITAGIINFTMKTQDPDVYTFNQNIVRITNTKVILSNA